jgi:hypothetical protein
MIKNSLILILLLCLIFSATPAQENSLSSKKIAYISSAALNDKKDGIEKLSNAYDALHSDNCRPLYTDEIDRLEKELKNRDLSGEERKTKEFRLKTLLEEQAERRQKRYSELKKLLIEPVEKEISNLIEQIEIQNGIIILDVDKYYESSQVLFQDEKFEITKQIVDYYKRKSKNPNEILNLIVPEIKLAVINTEKFYDNQKGIKSIIESKADYTNLNEICSKTQICIEIGKAISSFAKRNGYGFVFDSSKKLPTEISNYQITDATEEFISEYNNSNK